MIALRPMNGKIGKASWSIREGKTIPERILKTLDVEALKKAKVIGETKTAAVEKAVKEPESK